MTILVTRPSPNGEQLVEQLRRLGHSAWHFPLVEFVPGKGLPNLAEQLASLVPGDIVISVSYQSVSYAGPQLIALKQAWPSTLNYYAIGRRSALHLHHYCQQSVEYPREQALSERLLELTALQQVADRHVLILRGNGGRELLADTLIQRGATVSYCETYARLPINWDGAEQAVHWRRRGIGSIVVTSQEMLQRLFDLFPPNDRREWLLNCRLIVVSERVATFANQLGWHNVVIAKGADNDTLLQALH